MKEYINQIASDGMVGSYLDMATLPAISVG